MKTEATQPVAPKAPLEAVKSYRRGPVEDPFAGYRIAVLVPCHNEALSIAPVVEKFRALLPAATVYVYDNNSSDDTVAVATAAGASVRSEALPGKGNVVRRMFADVEADIYLLIDGDDTYDPASAPAMVECLLNGGHDMVTAVRISDARNAYRRGHRLGNKTLTGLVTSIFGNRASDMLSGYRAFSRRFVKSFPAVSGGFEIETELTVHALQLRMPIAEIDSPYSERPEGSTSKLRTYRDGARILKTILILVKEERPLLSFSIFAGLCILAAVLLGLPVVSEYLESGLVPRLPTAVLATGMMLLGFLGLVCGLILDTVTRSRQQLKRLFYLATPGLTPRGDTPD